LALGPPRGKRAAVDDVDERDHRLAGAGAPHLAGRRPARARVLATAPVVDGKRPHSALVADPRRALGDQGRDLVSVGGAQRALAVLPAGAGQPHRAYDPSCDRAGERPAGDPVARRRETAAEQDGDEEDDSYPLDRALSALAGRSRAHGATLGGTGSWVGHGCRERVPGAGRLLGARVRRWSCGAADASPWGEATSTALHGSVIPC
jgi:hypothetical protein